jgi:DNA polymerase phi
MRCLINQLSDSERYLNKAAAKATRAMLARAEAAPWTAPVIIKQLISNNGTPNFDHLTKGGTVGKMLSKADEAGLIEIVGSLHQVILDPMSSSPDLTGQEAERAAHIRRTWAADQIANIVKNGNSVKAESWLSKTAEMFVTFGYFDVIDKKRKSKTPIPTNTQGVFRARLMSCLTHLITLKGEHGETWPCRAVSVVNSLSKKTDKYTFAIELDETIQETVKKACRSLERIKKKRLSQASSASEAATRLLSFELLYSLIILQVYNGEADALGVLDDLQMIYDKYTEKEDNDGEEEEVDASELLVEILLSFISKPSNLSKRLAQTVFQSFCSTIRFNGLQSMFQVLDTDENVEGQQALFDNDDDDDGVAEEAEEDDDDVEMLDGSDDEGLDSDVEIISSPSDDEDDATTDNEAEQKKLETALAAVLQPADEGADSDSDADMSDDAMLKVDDHLSRIFAQRAKRSEQHKSKKNQKKEAKELIVGFKTRVLELMEIYVKTLPSSPLALEVLVPCIQLSRNTLDKNLAARSLNVIKALAASIKSSSTPPKLETEEQRQRAWILLHIIYDDAGDQTPGPLPQPRKAATSQAAIVCAKAILQGHPEEMDKLVDSWAQGVKRWLSERDFNPDKVFFGDFLSWVSSFRNGLLDGTESLENTGKKESKKKDVKKEQKGRASSKKGGEGNRVPEEVEPEIVKADKIEKKAKSKKQKERRETREAKSTEGDAPEGESKPKKKRKSKK